jgi:hypothetical protein
MLILLKIILPSGAYYKDVAGTGEIVVTPVVRELESLQHIVPDNNDANEDENADIFNSDSLDDDIGQ